MKEYKLGDIVTFHYGKSLPETKRVSGRFPVMSSAGITGWHNESLVKGPGVIVGRKGSIGTVFYEKRDFFPIDTCYFLTVNNTRVVDLKFMYYLLLGSNLKDLNSDAAVPGLNREIAYSQKFFIPELSAQNIIVDFIDAYNDFIENNNRRIAILEDMAQSLYREWFVNFRYPNHQDNLDAKGKPKLIESPLGQIPEGWEVKRLDEVADINPQSITQRNAPEKIGYIDISSVGTGVIDEVKPMLFNEAPSRARRVVVDGDIIWATVRPNRKQYSFICKPLPNTIVSTGFAVIRSKSLPESYLYSFTTTDSFTGYLINHATGSAYPAVNSDIFQKAGILVPPKNLVEKFDEFCSRAISLSEVLKKKNANLKQQRDMLLPKLISGQIELKD